MTAVQEQNVSAGEAENNAKGLRSDLLELFDRCKLNLSPVHWSRLEIFLYEIKICLSTEHRQSHLPYAIETLHVRSPFQRVQYLSSIGA